jgi:hypothetical protein
MQNPLLFVTEPRIRENIIILYYSQVLQSKNFFEKITIVKRIRNKP